MTESVKVILLGTGGPRPDPQRNGPSVVLRVGSQNLLFDCGRGCVVQLLRANIPLADVGPVFVTHHHFDHIGDLYDVMLSTWMGGRKEPLEIFGPPDTRRIVDALLTQVFDKDIEWRDKGEPAMGGWKPIVTRDIAPGEIVAGMGWQVSAETVVHGHGLTLSPGFLRRWICYGYRIEIGGKVIVISGDTVDCGGLQKLACGADLLVQCCYLAGPEISSEHFRRLAKYTLACGDTVGKIAAKAGVKALALTHHRPRPGKDMIKVLAEEVARDFSGRIIVAEDLCEIEV